MSLIRQVKGDETSYKNVIYSQPGLGQYVELWWRKDMQEPLIEANYYGTARRSSQSLLMAEMLRAAALEGEAWEKDPPWERSIAEAPAPGVQS